MSLLTPEAPTPTGDHSFASFAFARLDILSAAIAHFDYAYQNGGNATLQSHHTGMAQVAVLSASQPAVTANPAESGAADPLAAQRQLVAQAQPVRSADTLSQLEKI